MNCPNPPSSSIGVRVRPLATKINNHHPLGLGLGLELHKSTIITATSCTLRPHTWAGSEFRVRFRFSVRFGVRFRVRVEDRFAVRFGLMFRALEPLQWRPTVKLPSNYRQITVTGP